REVAVPVAIDGNTEISRQQRPAEQRLEGIELLVEVRDLLIPQRVKRDQRTSEDARGVVGRVHPRDGGWIGSDTPDQDVQQEVVVGARVPAKGVVEREPAECRRSILEIHDAVTKNVTDGYLDSGEVVVGVERQVRGRDPLMQQMSVGGIA